MRRLPVIGFVALLSAASASAQDASSFPLERIKKQIEAGDTAGLLRPLTGKEEYYGSSKDSLDLFQTLILKGNYYFLKDEQLKVFGEYLKALHLAEKMRSDSLRAEAYFNIGEKHYEFGNYVIAIKNFLLAEPLYRRLGNEERVAQLSRLCGHMHHTLGSLKEALKYYGVTLDYFQKQKDEKNIGALLNNIGICWTDLNDTARAMEYLLKSYGMMKVAGDQLGIARVYGNIGQLLFKGGNYKRALDYYQKQLDLRVKYNTPRTGHIESLIYVGKALHKLGRNSEALPVLDDAIKRCNFPDSYELERRALEVLREIHYEKGDFKKAYELQQRYYFLNDTLYDREKTAGVITASVSQDFEKKMYEDSLRTASEKQRGEELQREKDKRQAFITGGLALAFLFVLGIAFLFYKRNTEKKKANAIITRQKNELEVRQAEIRDSINYAKHIQQAILPDPKAIVKAFPDCFGLYLPKDVVSGDFYWFTERGPKKWIAAADCTGHGVPGAFMSMIGIDKLNQSILDISLQHPSDILSSVNMLLKNALKQDEGSSSRDGMDIALCSFDPARLELEYAGAHRPMWIVRNERVIEHKPTKAAIGGLTDLDQEFQNYTVKLEKGDAVYIFTDGYADQFGGEKGKKLMTSSLKKLFVSVQHLPMSAQEAYLLQYYNEWKGDREQIDDVLIIGIRV